LTILAAAKEVFNKVIAYNPNMSWVEEVHDYYKQIEDIWNDGWDKGSDDMEKNRNNAGIMKNIGKQLEKATALILENSR